MENTNKQVAKTNNSGMGVTEMQIKKGFEEAKTWADANEVIAKMSVDQVIEMRNALETTSKYSGLDMRQDFVLNLLKHEVEERARKKESKLFRVVSCGRCGHIIEHTETDEYGESSYEADKKLSETELKKAIREGDVAPSNNGLGGCESCIDSPAFQEDY